MRDSNCIAHGVFTHKNTARNGIGIGESHPQAVLPPGEDPIVLRPGIVGMCGQRPKDGDKQQLGTSPPPLRVSPSHLQSSSKNVSRGVPGNFCRLFSSKGEGKSTSHCSPRGHLLHLTGLSGHNLLGGVGDGESGKGKQRSKHRVFTVQYNVLVGRKRSCFLFLSPTRTFAGNYGLLREATRYLNGGLGRRQRKRF